jgi:predicted MFS family arabinose efflux permease
MAAFMVQADARVIDPLLHVIAREFQTTPPAAAVLISSYALPYGLFQLLYGPIGDRIGKLRVMAGCLAVFSFGTFACAFVPTIPAFAVLRFVTGVAAAAVIPMSLGYIGDKFPYADRQIALGRFMSALMIGQIVGSTLGGLFGQYVGWRYIFIVFGGVAVAVSALLVREGRRFPEPAKAARPLGASILTVPSMVSRLALNTATVGLDFVAGRISALSDCAGWFRGRARLTAPLPRTRTEAMP